MCLTSWSSSGQQGWGKLLFTALSGGERNSHGRDTAEDGATDRAASQIASDEPTAGEQADTLGAYWATGAMWEWRWWRGRSSAVHSWLSRRVLVETRSWIVKHIFEARSRSRRRYG